MRKYLFLVISLCLLFTGCDNFFSKGNGNSNLGSSVLRLELAQNKKLSKTARTISPANENPFSDVDVWKIEFISPSYTDAQENVSFTNGAYDVQLPVGTYTINIEGVITDEQTLAQIVWVGSASNVEVIAGETVSAEIQVSLKKEGKGSFIYTVDLNLPNPKYVGDFVVELKNLDNGNIISVSQGSPSEEFGNASTDGSVSMKNIPAGFYKVDIKYLDMSDGKYHSALLPDPLVEIIGNVVSSGTSQAIQLGTSRVYYATTDASDYNGLTENNPANFYSLIHMLAESSDWEDVKIYCDDKPDTAAINAGDIAKIQKEIKVYCNNEVYITFKNYNIDVYTGFVEVPGVTINGTETWTPMSEIFLDGMQFAIPDLLVCDHEVTRGEYKAIMGIDPSTAAAYDKDGNELTGDAVLYNPVNTVSWYDAIAYCNKLSISEGLTPCYSVEGVTDWKNFAYSSVPTEDNDAWNAVICNIEADGYRLPTEAEWEWLARGGENYEYAGSNNASDVAWYNQTTGGTGTRTVKTKLPNGYGLYDMCGNVFEWCWDREAKYILPGSNRVLRGGSWDVNAYTCTDRVEDWPDVRSEYEYQEYGFRVVRTINIRQKEDMIKVQGVTITGTETWTPTSSVFVSGRQLTIPDLIVCDHEVTRGEFVAVMGELTDQLTYCYDKAGSEVTGDALLNVPVGTLNWYQVMAYCNKLSLREGLTPCYSVEGVDDWGYLKFSDIPAYNNANLTTDEENRVDPWKAATCNFNANGYRLPTEAEWEWLARGGDDHTIYAGSNTEIDVAWSLQTGVYGSHLVKLLQPNGYGLYDMSGNLYEMCWDEFSYPITSSTPATGVKYGRYRVVRGGCYDKECSMAFDAYLGYSGDVSDDCEYVMSYRCGFRVVRTNSPVVGYEGSGSTNDDTFNWYETPIDVSTGLPATSSSTYVYFGVFPKTVLTPDGTITIKGGNTKTVGANTYYKGSDGNWYAKVVENANGASYTYSDGSTVEQASASSTRYFKVEPITWKVVTPNYNSSGKALLMAENVLTASIPFYETTTARNINGTVYANNYKYSTVRAYLNGKYETDDTQTNKYKNKGFLQTAFTTTAQSLIADTEVKNSADTASNDSSVTLKLNTCEDTVDKIFLLSLSEVINAAYGFDTYVTSSNADLNTTRHRTPTDFAKANNVIISSNRATWWLRSPYGTESTASTEAVRTVSYQGAVNGNGPANTMYYGLLPALTIELQ